MASTAHLDFKGHHPKVRPYYKAMQCAAVFLLGLMLLAGPTSCKKDPQPSPTPTPNTPMDTVTPANPGDTIIPTPGDTIVPGSDTVQYSGKTVKFIYSGGENFVPLDTIRKHLALGDSVVLAWGVENSYDWTPVGFCIASDSLRKRFNLCPQRIGGDGLMMVYQILPDCDSMAINKKGVAQNVATWYSNKGYNVYPVVTGGKGQKVIKANNKAVRQPRYNAYPPRRGRSR